MLMVMGLLTKSVAGLLSVPLGYKPENTVSVDISLPSARYPDEPARTRAAKQLLARATTVETALGRIVKWEEAAQAFSTAFQSVFDLDLQPSDLTPREKIRAEDLATIKYSHPEWTQKQSD